MRFSLWQCCVITAQIGLLCVVWLTSKSSDEDVEIRKRSLEFDCDYNVMWKYFDKTGDYSFPWITVDELLLNKEAKQSCSDLYQIPVVNLSLVPPTIHEKKEVKEYTGNTHDITSNARFYYFIMKANAFPYSENKLPNMTHMFCRPELGLKIPNIIHYIWDQLGDLELYHYISIRSAMSIHRPTRLLVHYLEKPPNGDLWDKINSKIPCVHAQKITDFPKYYKKVESHKNDILRLNILQKYGGIFSDFSNIFLRPMDSLLNNSVVIGEDHQIFRNDLILSEPNSNFIKKWISSFQNYSVIFPKLQIFAAPKIIYDSNPEYDVKVVSDKFSRPSEEDGFEWLTKKNWNLENNFCVKFYFKNFIPASLPFLKLNQSALVHLDSTFGQMVRKSLYGQFHFDFFKTPTIMEKRLARDAIIHCNIKTKEEKIPRILHFVATGNDFSYHQYISLRSAVKYLKPVKVIIHSFVGSKMCENELFLRIKNEIKCIQFETIPSLDYQFVNVYKSNARKKTDVVLQILYKYGGIFLDENILPTKSINNTFFNNSIVMQGGDKKPKLGDTVLFIMAEKGSKIIQEWFNRQPARSLYTSNGVEFAHSAKGISLFDFVKSANPNIFFKNINIRDSHMYHFNKKLLYTNMNTLEQNEILASDTTYGKLARYALTGITSL